MPKRYGYIWEELTSIEHCEKTALYAIRNKKKTRYLMYVKKHYKKYAIRLQKILLEGWDPGEPRLKTIKEGPRKKARDLKIPSLNDHFVHTAVIVWVIFHLQCNLVALCVPVTDISSNPYFAL